ncbi:RNA-directed DNA polymerase (Reverse transcriptase) [Imhoffiella purpurea]|uniref:RNA-directed DNA polymerase (Reverse transcriptase) n=1 Tax=Imhoffiella purpurea TaxID=1249627 RepID=W9V6F9_9GAMM|nr:RNA-directed DNA polymerase (Reverse transcriptase) [Imhoffiella purpurea]
MPDAVGLEHHEPTSLWGIAKRALACKDHRFQDLYRLLDAGLLLESWDDLNKNAASGVDRVTAEAYEQELIANIRDLAERLKRKRYRAKRVRRCYIPKESGGERPLGIPALEDKLVQLACAKILNAIYEQDFLPVSYGYRPGRGAKDAVRDLGFNLQYGRFGHVVEADIKGFFDTLDHERLLEMLSLRIDDRAFLDLIRQWLKAGILDTDGTILHPVTGTPQGGVVSPILANVYLHHVLDRWFEDAVKPRCGGQAILIRYADDYVCAFQYRRDAERFYRVMPKRLEKFGLEVAPEKTRILRFSRFHPGLRRRFAFLGFELYWNRDRRGELRVMKRTARKKLQQAKRRMKDWIRANRHLPGRQFIQGLNRKLVGHYNYFGLRSNQQALGSFYSFSIACAFKWLNRRGGKRRSFNWGQFKEALKKLGVALPRIVEKQREHVAFV